MNINITSRKFKAKDTLKDLIVAEVKSLEKFNDDILDVDVILSYRHNKDSIKMAELSLQLPRKTIVISEESENFEKSVSVSVDKLKRQLKQIKSRKKIRPTKV